MEAAEPLSPSLSPSLGYAAAPAPTPKSEVKGIQQTASGKWYGTIYDKLTKKYKCTPHFANEADAIKAFYELRARIDDEFWRTRTALAEADPLTKDLPLGPNDPAEAEPGTVYWRPNKSNEQKPGRAVRVGARKVVWSFDELHVNRCVQRKQFAALAEADPLTKGLPIGPDKATEVGFGVVYAVPNKQHQPYRAVRSGARWAPACQHPGCATLAQQAIKGGPARFCAPHGGHCPHGHHWLRCRECNPKVTETSACCSECGVVLNGKRTVCNGGNKLCPMCEDKLNREADDNGSAPPPKSKKWEDVVLDQLEPLIVDKDGRKISSEMRDDLSNMFGSNKRRRVGECDTLHQRRPDVLYVKRDDQGHVVAMLNVEVDEHSHETRDSQCEAGKIDDTVQAMLTRAQDEGKRKGAPTRGGKIRIPAILFLRFNPNACDAPGGGVIRLETRIKVLARICNEFLNTHYSDFHAQAERDETMRPRVQCLYYHTKIGKGGQHLKYYDEHAAGAFDWLGNACPRA